MKALLAALFLSNTACYGEAPKASLWKSIAAGAMPKQQIHVWNNSDGWSANGMKYRTAAELIAALENQDTAAIVLDYEKNASATQDELNHIAEKLRIKNKRRVFHHIARGNIDSPEIFFEFLSS